MPVEVSITAAGGVEVQGVKRIRLGKVIPLGKETTAAERVLHIETDTGDFSVKLIADHFRDLQIEVLNPITAV